MGIETRRRVREREIARKSERGEGEKWGYLERIAGKRRLTMR